MPRPMTPRDTAEYRNARATRRDQCRPCWLCGQPIRYDLRAPHPASFTADHVGELNRGGTNDPENLRPAHYGCNSRRGAVYRNTGRSRGAQPERDW